MLDPKSENFVEQMSAALLDADLLDNHALVRARKAHQDTGERFDHILTRLGLLSENKLAEVLADRLSMRLISKDDYPDNALRVEELQLKFLRSNKVLPIMENEERIILAVADPFNFEAVNAVAYLMEKPVDCCLTLNADFESEIDRLYKEDNKEPDQDAFEHSEFSSDDVERLRDIASEAPIIQLVNQLITQAVEQGASDLHIEPLENAVRVRFRIDGVLTEVQSLPLSMQSAVTSRIKILGKLNIAERRLPQDGRIRLAVRGQDIDIRLSTTPTYHGESIVLRILDQNALSLDFETLGFYGQASENYQNLLSRPHGIILVTGPTGSGKTTTLYASLDTLNSETRKVFTVEDPVEYQLQGVNQLQVQPKVGLTFAAALRSILRQDPDIIMVGEIRDLETAQIAIQSSLTGHMVLSTLHTNSAAATITRLLDMGVEDYLLASTIRGVLAQRLVRRLCSGCSRPAEVKDSFIDKLQPSAAVFQDIGGRENINIRQPVGCSSCNNTGFDGRTTIMELLVMNDEVQENILGSGSQSELEQVAVSSGMKTLYQDGLTKAFRGETTVEEVLRLTGLK